MLIAIPLLLTPMMVAVEPQLTPMPESTYSHHSQSAVYPADKKKLATTYSTLTGGGGAGYRDSMTDGQ